MSNYFQKGDKVRIFNPFWWYNENLGNKIGRVIDITGYILIEIQDFENNPVKCFRNEIEIIEEHLNFFEAFEKETKN